MIGERVLGLKQKASESLGAIHAGMCSDLEARVIAHLKQDLDCPASEASAWALTRILLILYVLSFGRNLRRGPVHPLLATYLLSLRRDSSGGSRPKGRRSSNPSEIRSSRSCRPPV